MPFSDCAINDVNESQETRQQPCPLTNPWPALQNTPSNSRLGCFDLVQLYIQLCAVPKNKTKNRTHYGCFADGEIAGCGALIRVLLHSRCGAQLLGAKPERTSSPWGIAVGDIWFPNLSCSRHNLPARIANTQTQVCHCICALEEGWKAWRRGRLSPTLSSSACQGTVLDFLAIGRRCFKTFFKCLIWPNHSLHPNSCLDEASVLSRFVRAEHTWSWNKYLPAVDKYWRHGFVFSCYRVRTLSADVLKRFPFFSTTWTDPVSNSSKLTCPQYNTWSDRLFRGRAQPSTRSSELKMLYKNLWGRVLVFLRPLFWLVLILSSMNHRWFSFLETDPSYTGTEQYNEV